MRRRLPLIVLILACGALPATAAAKPIALRIEFLADPGATPRILRLRCAERATGTVQHPGVACRRLRQLGATAFRPTPAGTACTEISGGPSTAVITGMFSGRPLWVSLSLANG